MDSEKLNGVDDIKWLCSLNETELDFLMSLKVMLLRRAKQMGSKALAKKFDLKFLRALGFIFINKLKGHLQSSIGSSSSSSLDNCKLLKFDIDTCFKNLSIQELDTYICTEKRKRSVLSMLLEDMPPGQKQRS
ncbi:unnamed protein product [Cuscuta epithymum]|uniref:Uncharacterized protein n=1 Tax=Cuscuta epithymum TaxID=186058 RepID=A0AAV0DAQ1_9ASTE|nr:unnamed protein product [Cuscuta epithymum]